MDDLISRQDAIDAVHYYIESGYKCDIFQELKDLPSAESVIRCKDCRHWLPSNGLCEIWEWYISNDAFYCGYGERRTDE